jgi:hypothetical protein
MSSGIDRKRRKTGMTVDTEWQDHADNQDFKLWDINWRIGRNWGIAHPDHTCWCSGDMVFTRHDAVNSSYDAARLGIGKEYREFYSQTYPWKVGYISSVDTFKYGAFTFFFILPRGRHLWPAIWLTDGKTWPPEIDIVEGWTNDKSEKHPYRKYSHDIFPICCTNKIFPGLVTGNCLENKGGKSYYNLFHGTNSKYMDTDLGINSCMLEWNPNKIAVWYNGHKVMEETNPDMLRWFNESDGMEIHLDNYVMNEFSFKDFDRLKEDEKYLIIEGLDIAE